MVKLRGIGPAIVLVVIVSATLLQARQASLSQPQSSAHQRKSYAKWLAEDVAYIVTPEEKSQFERLTTDAERDRFIEQFWLKRDPTPGTPENEFKEEHYRRIAYSNAHFAQKVPGWQTDRGRAYIVDGPPDQIDTHPSTSAKHATQLWRYRKGTQFEFVDDCDCGNYRLVTK